MPITVKHIQPPLNLRPFVQRFWEVFTTEAADMRILPDGSWDFVVHIGGSSCELEFVGPMTKAIVIPLTPDVQSYGVRFRPGAYLTQLKADLADYQNKSVPLVELMPNVSLQHDRPILPQLEILVKTLVAQRTLTSSTTVDTVLAALACLADDAAIASLINSQTPSQRTIERQFRRYVGLSPKQFVRISRQLAVAGELLLRQQPQLGQLAASFGYVDQAHMTHDIRLLSGTTPHMLHDEYDEFLQYDWPYNVHTGKV